VQRTPGNVRRQEAFARPPQLARFFRGARLETMPKHASDRAAVLAYIATSFERDRDYDESEVNRVLARVDADFATLRRHLVDAGLLTRASGVYRRA
jgi:hypothetical protein